MLGEARADGILDILTLHVAPIGHTIDRKARVQIDPEFVLGQLIVHELLIHGINVSVRIKCAVVDLEHTFRIDL